MPCTFFVLSLTHELNGFRTRSRSLALGRPWLVVSVFHNVVTESFSRLCCQGEGLTVGSACYLGIVSSSLAATICDHSQREALSEILTAAGSFLSSHSCAVGGALARVALRASEPRTALYECGSLSLSSTSVSVRHPHTYPRQSDVSHAGAVHEPNQQVPSLTRELLRSQVQRVRPCWGSSPLRSCCCVPPPGATSAGSQCASLCPILCCS